MSFLGDIFGGSEGGFKAIPDTEEQKKARQLLLDLMNRNIQYPVLNVPGVTGYQQQALGLLRDYLAKPSSGYLAGMGELEKTVAGGYDPRTSPTYAGYRESSEMDEAAAVNALGRSQQQRGIYTGSPALKQEGQVRRSFLADRNKVLGGLVDTERARQLSAAPTLASLSTSLPIQKITAGLQLGEVPRTIEAAQDEALYNALMGTLLFPYQSGQITGPAKLAAGLLGEQRYAYQPGTPSPLASGLGMGLGQGLGNLFGGGGGLSSILSGGGNMLGGLGNFLLGGPTGGFTADMALETSPGLLGSILGGAGGLVSGGAGALTGLLSLL